jgi:5-hydroxyisourate hydrolase
MITTHVLDTAKGRPAANVRVVLEQSAMNQWQTVASGATDTDGRLKTLWPESTPLVPGIYRLLFDTSSYFAASGTRAFYPQVVIVFEAASGEAHYHVPLLLSPYGYTTYRGS